MFWSNYPLWLQYFSIGSFMFASGVLMFRLPLAPFIILTVFSWLGLLTGNNAIPAGFKCSVWTIIWHTLFIIIPFFIVLHNAKSSLDVPFGQALNHSLWTFFVILPTLIILLIAFAFSFLFAVGKWVSFFSLFGDVKKLQVIAILCFAAGVLLGLMTLKVACAFSGVGFNNANGSTAFVKGLGSVLQSASFCLVIALLAASGVKGLGMGASLLAAFSFFYMGIDGSKQSSRVKTGVVSDWDLDKSPLQIACMRGQVDKVGELISSKVDINKGDNNGVTPLMQAVMGARYGGQEYIEIAKMLIEAGADVSMADKNGDTALIHSAESEEDFEVFNKLLATGADVNKANNDGVTPLMRAGGINKTRALIEAGADVNARDNKGRSALLYAEKEDVMKELLKAGLDPNTQDDEGKTLLMKRATWEMSGVDKLASCLLENGADVNIADKEGKTALMYAAKQGPATVEALIKAGADVNHADNNGVTPLMVAYYYNYGGVEDVLIQNGANVNAVDKNGNTVVMRDLGCSYENHIYAVFNAGLDIKIKNKNGEDLRALIAKTDDYHAKQLEYFVAVAEGDFQPDYKYEIGSTTSYENGQPHTEINYIAPYENMIAYAAEHNYLNWAEKLIKGGVNINNTDALCAAAQRGNLEMVKKLIKAGANINHKDRDGKTALDYAEQKEYNEIVDLLKEYSAE